MVLGFARALANPTYFGIFARALAPNPRKPYLTLANPTYI